MKENKNSTDNTVENKNDSLSENENTGDNSVSEGAPALVEVNEEKINKIESELGEQKEKYIRLIAEFDNFKRRSRKEHYEMEQTAGKDIITSLLVVLDDMDRAAKQMESTTDVNAIKEGVTLVFNKMRSIMQKRGLKQMSVTKELFNPDFHEAITEIPVPEEDMQGMIIDVVEPGYYLNEKLIRHAKVVIGKLGEPRSL